MMQFRSPKYNASGSIDLEIQHPALGWIPSTVSSGDLFEAARAAGPAPYTPPTIDLAAVRAEMRLTFAQLMIGLVTEGWVTEAEADGWLAGTLPPAVTAVINTLPDAHRFAARARAVRPSEVARLDPLVSALAAAQGKSAEQIDAFFFTYR